jgi:preprotein translocase subunit YajC
MMTLMISAVVAKPMLAAAMLLQAAAPQGGGLFSLLPLLLMIPIFYFLLILPNQRRQKKWQEMLGQLKAGDKVTTTGGLRGTVLTVKDDTLQLRLPPDNLRVEVAKASIASVTTDEETK